MRARLVAPIVAIAVTAGGCGATEKPSSDGGKGDSAVDGGDDDAPATLYGGVPFDAGNG